MRSATSAIVLLQEQITSLSWANRGYDLRLIQDYLGIAIPSTPFTTPALPPDASKAFGVESGRFHAESDQTFTVLERWAFFAKFLVDGGSGAIMLDQRGYHQGEINKPMSRLTIVGYEDPYQAEEVRLKLLKLQREYVMALKDAVVAVKDEQGKVRLHQSVDFNAGGTFSFSFWDR